MELPINAQTGEVSPNSNNSAIPSTPKNERSSTLITQSIHDILRFKKRRIHGEHSVRTLLPQHVLHHTHCQHSEETEPKIQQIRKHHKHYAKNGIQTTKYTVLSFLPKNLFEQFHRFANCYFVFIILLNFIPQIGAIQPFLSMAPVILILVVQALKDLVEDYGRYKSDKSVNNAEAEVILSADDKYHRVKWSDLQVGDIVRVVCNDVIPADVLLLHSSDVDGRCFIETSNIDGETNLKQRTVVQRHWGLDKPNEFHPRDFKSIIECQTPNNEIYKFHGNIIPPDNGDKIPINNNNLLLRGCVIRNTDYVEGIVIYAGHETKAMLNNNGPRHKRSKLERRMNTDVLYCVALLIIMCLIGSIGNGIWAAQQNSINQTELYLPRTETGENLDPALSGFYMFWTMIILLQVLIPISLYVSIELVKWAQVYMINTDIDMYHEETDTPIRCRALNITEDLGQIQYIFSDKTGTLTENQMVFRRCTVGGVDYPHAANAARIENLEPTPADINPATSKHAEAFPSRENHSRQSYRRPFSGSIRPHHSKDMPIQARSLDKAFKDRSIESRSLDKALRNLSAHIRPHTADPVSESDGTDYRISKSAPNSPGLSRKSKPSTRRPAAHHRRTISSVSAKEVQATIANHVEGPDDVLEDPAVDDLETDVTPDPVLFKQLQSIENPHLERSMGLEMSVKKGRILDFFVNLAICNTVVISSVEVEEAQEAVPKVLATATSDRYTAVSTDNSPETPHSKNHLQKSVHFETESVGNSSATPKTKPDRGKSFTTEELSRIRYEAESPDEAALVYAAHAYGCVLAHRSSKGGRETVTITLPNGEGTMLFEVLHKLPFDSARKRMSVIVRNPLSGQITLYCKGADSAILTQLADCPEHARFDLSDSFQDDVAKRPSNAFDVVSKTKKFLDAYARTGLRTLCISKKNLSPAEYASWLVEYQQADSSFENRDQLMMNTFNKMETELELLGATGIEDRLQDGVPETIEALRQAGIQVWVLTGDKQETAVNIGYSCRLIHQSDEVIQLNAETKEAFKELLENHIADQDQKRGGPPTYDKQNSILNSLSFVLPNSTSYPAIDDKDQTALVLVIDGKTLAFALQKDLQDSFVNLARRCRSVLCCRATPLQKGEVVKLIRHELNVMTLAIGDGANDVSMIQVADVGIGLSGQEGLQAVMSSDYALAQFRFLRKLLLVHGHWNYARLASMVLYFFYKNAAFVFLIFWFQILCGFSGSNMIEQWYLILFNLIFTSVPPLVNGVLDKDVSANSLLRKPSLYKQGMNDELYLKHTFWFNILDAVYQSVIIFFFIYLVYADSPVGLIEWGTVITSASVFVILIHLGIETKTWTWMHWLSQIGSVLIYFAFGLIYNIVCPACSPPSNPYFVMERVIQTPQFWFSILLVTIVALFPRFLIRTLQSDFFPSESQKERILEKYRKEAATATTSLASSSNTSNSSTYRNPTFQAYASPGQPSDMHPDMMFSPNKMVIETTSPSRGQQYGGSTPDLSSKSPYYGSHNSNNSNNSLFTRRTVLPQAGAEELSAYVNSAFSRSSPDCEQDSDTGECRQGDSVEPRRKSLRHAYGDDNSIAIPTYEEVAAASHPSSEIPYDDAFQMKLEDVVVTSLDSEQAALDENYSRDVDV